MGTAVARHSMYVTTVTLEGAVSLPSSSIFKDVALLAELKQTIPIAVEKATGEQSEGTLLFSSPVIGEQGDERAPFSVTLPQKQQYFSARELTQMPQVKQDIPPEKFFVITDFFPRPAIVRLLINRSGDVDEVEIEDSFLSEETVRLLKNEFSKVKFEPAKRGDEIVNSQLKIEVMPKNANAKTVVAPIVIEQTTSPEVAPVKDNVKDDPPSEPATLTPPSSLPPH